VTGTKSFADALSTCAALPAPPGATWRLPSRIELVTLLDLTPSKSRKIDTAAFPSTEGSPYWTSSEVRPDVDGKRAYWTVDFKNGGLAQEDSVDGRAAVRCILGLTGSR
jgi:hypothetical protein